MSINKLCLAGLALTVLLGDDVNATNQDTSVKTLQSFEKLFGVTPAKRRNHTTGFCFEAKLVPIASDISAFSDSELFKNTSNVIGRLSHKGGKNNHPDDKAGEYGMGLSITTLNGEKHMMSMNTLDFFPVSTPEAFAQLMQAKMLGGDAVKAFKKQSEDLQRFKAHEAEKDKTLKPYEGQVYNSVNSFYLVDNNGRKTAVRWSFTPAANQGIKAQISKKFFYENMRQNLKEGKVAWNMSIAFATPNDDVDNAAIPWSKSNKTMKVAQLQVAAVQHETNGRCDSINFDPLVLSKGFAPSNDPLLQARRAIYALGFGKRTAEKSKGK